MSKLIDLIESKYKKKDMPQFSIGDTVELHVKIVEEGRSRIQVFEGIVIARAGSGIRETVTVRKISYGEGVEMVCLIHSPSIEKIVAIKKGDVRRAKIYYLKKKIGKETKVEEKIAQEESPRPSPPREEAP